MSKKLSIDEFLKLVEKNITKNSIPGRSHSLECWNICCSDCPICVPGKECHTAIQFYKDNIKKNIKLVESL